MTIQKYIRFTNDFYLIFPHDNQYPTHAQMAEAMKERAGMQGLSAGQIMIDDGIVICAGSSASLGVESLREKDSEFFTPRIFLPGVSKAKVEAD